MAFQPMPVTAYPVRVLCPDDHPDRWSPDPAKRGEAFASVARALRDEVLPDPAIRRVVVLVGPPGAGKTTTAAELARVEWEAGTVIVDACHADQPMRIGLVKRIRAAGKQAVAVVMHTPTAECVRRDALREPPRRAGQRVIEQKAAELRHYPPTRAEGWTSIVTLDPSIPDGRSEDLGMLVMASQAMLRGRDSLGRAS